MIKKNLKILIVTSIIVLLPIIAGLVLWNDLPDQIPVHWNAANEVDNWASKPVAVFGFPALMLAVHWLCMFATVADPKKQNHPEKVKQMLFWFVPVLNIVLSAVTYTTAMGGSVRVEVLLPVLLGVLFAIIGNYLPKCKQNYTIGIKIPWTLASEENWNKTHRLAGYIWVAGGVLIIVLGFFGLVWGILPIALVMTLVPFAYSYILYRKGV